MVFPGLVQRQVLASWNIKIICHHFQLIVVFVSLPYFTLPVELVLCFFLPVSLTTTFIAVVDLLNAFKDSPVRQIICTGNISAYDKKLNKGMI